MIRIILRIGFFTSVPLVFAGVILMGSSAYKELEKKLYLHEDCENCTSEMGYFRESPDSKSLEVNFTYEGSDYVIKASLNPSLLKGYVNKRVKYYFDRNEPTFNRIDIPEENEQFSQYLIGFLVTLFILMILILGIKKTKAKS